VSLIKSCPADRNIFSIGVDLERTGLAFNQSEPLRETLHSPWFDGSFDSLPEAAASSSLMGMNRVAGGSTSGRASPHLQTQSLLLQGRRPSTLESIIPSCYQVPSIPPAASKIGNFADETLFYIFYSMPGDRMQDSAARELNVRGWRFHIPTKSWIKEDKEGVFFMFDASAWIKVKRQLSVQASDLEESRAASSTGTQNGSEKMVMHGSGTLQNHSVTH
jgi:CCR4-NOT transcription complex subunit 2